MLIHHSNPFLLSYPASGLAWIVTDVILFSMSGLYVFGFTGSFSNSSIASKPSITRPNIVYLRSKCGCEAYVMKNWLAFVLGPLKEEISSTITTPMVCLEKIYLFAIETMPRSWCFNVSLNSSSNFRPHIDCPPFPVPVGSPVCTINPFMLRWNNEPL